MPETANDELTLAITPLGVVRVAENRFDLQLIFDATAPSGESVIKVVSVLQFQYEGIDDIATTPYFVQNVPAIAFPYIRAYIGALTTLSGAPPILLRTLNLSSQADLLRQNIAVFDN